MRFFQLLNYQHAMGSLVVPLIFMVIFAVGLSVMPMVNSKEKKSSVKPHQFNDNISEGDSPFPMVMAIIIIGTIIWALFYILYYGFSEVNI